MTQNQTFASSNSPRVAGTTGPGGNYPISIFSIVPEVIVSASEVDLRSPAAMISFVVDNNPRAVIYELQQRGYNVQGLNAPGYKQLIWTAFLQDKNLSWLGEIPFIATVGNWTNEQYARALVNRNANKGFGDWIDNNIGTIGSVIGALAGVVPIVSGILGMTGGNSGGSPSTATPPLVPSPGTIAQPVPITGGPKEPIMGLEPGLFWGLALVAVIIIALVLYLMMRRK